MKKSNLRKFLGFLVCLIFFLFLNTPISAQVKTQVSDGQINEAIAKTVPLRFLPSSPFYFLITIKETVSRAFQPSSAKRAEFDELLSQKRLKESYLLIKSGDLSGGKKSLLRYRDRLKVMEENIDKARSQNQDVIVIVSEIAEDFKNQEILLAALNTRFSKEGIDEEIAKAIEAFDGAVMFINNISPGVKNRFVILPAKEASSEATPAASQEIEPQTPFPSANPKRIIY